ncbi:MAG: hypothetical protein ACR2N5_00940 [Solirubrobacterales bacterium]
MCSGSGDTPRSDRLGLAASPAPSRFASANANTQADVRRRKRQGAAPRSSSSDGKPAGTRNDVIVGGTIATESLQLGS